MTVKNQPKYSPSDSLIKLGEDLRALRSLLISGFGWTVMPAFLCETQIRSGELNLIKAPVGNTQLSYYMAWAPSVLRQPRIAHARQTLLWSLKPAQD